MVSTSSPSPRTPPTRMPSGRALVCAAAALVLALGTAGCTGTSSEAADPDPLTGLHGEQPDVPSSRPSIVLTDTDGAPYDLVAETSGKPTLLYFGYTDCPDECPTALAYIQSALRTSDQATREATEVVFITTDPDRDSAERLKSWLDTYGFGKDVVGLRGTAEEIELAQRLAGAPVATKGRDVETLPGQPNAHVHRPGAPEHDHDRPLGYGVAHATDIFAYDASDRLAVLYPMSVTPADLRADLPVLASKE